MEEEKRKAEERAKVEFTPEERLLGLKAALEVPTLLKEVDHKQLFNF